MSYRFSRKNIRRPVRKAGEPDVLAQLRAFLDTAEPELAAILVSRWGYQGNAITYKDLREAILRGDLDPALVLAWQQDYVRFVRNHLQPAWQAAMVTAAGNLHVRQPQWGRPWSFDPMADGVQAWTEQRAADFVTSVTRDQIDGLRAVVQRAAALEQLSVDELSRVIRPMVGLYQGQAEANLNYYRRLIESGVSQQMARDKAIRYAGRQHRYRAFMIARTELAFAYNQGAYLGTKQAQASGLLPEVVKEWSTAFDERVCPACGGMDGMRRAMDEPFPFETRLTDPAVKLMPPAHPNCRCAVKFVEVTP